MKITTRKDDRGIEFERIEDSLVGFVKCCIEKTELGLWLYIEFKTPQEETRTYSYASPTFRNVDDYSVYYHTSAGVVGFFYHLHKRDDVYSSVFTAKDDIFEKLECIISTNRIIVIYQTIMLILVRTNDGLIKEYLFID